MDFGRKIRKLRKDKNMNQQDLADVLGLNLNTISHWENLEFPFKDKRKLSQLAEVLGTTVDFLCGDEVSPAPAEDDPCVHRATLDLEVIMKDLVYKYPDLAIGFRDTRENWEALPENDKKSIADALMLAFGPEGHVPMRLKTEGQYGQV